MARETKVNNQWLKTGDCYMNKSRTRGNKALLSWDPTNAKSRESWRPNTHCGVTGTLASHRDTNMGTWDGINHFVNDFLHAAVKQRSINPIQAAALFEPRLQPQNSCCFHDALTNSSHLVSFTDIESKVMIFSTITHKHCLMSLFAAHLCRIWNLSIKLTMRHHQFFSA